MQEVYLLAYWVCRHGAVVLAGLRECYWLRPASLYAAQQSRTDPWCSSSSRAT